LYRYGPNGQIYLCRKVNGRNVWKTLQTADRKRAMAIAAFTLYAAGQNGNTELVPPLQPLAATPTAPLPSWLARREVEMPSPPPPITTTQTATLNDRLNGDLIPASSPPHLPPPPAGIRITIRRPAGVTLANLVDRFRQESGHLARSTRQTLDCHFKVAADHFDFGREVSKITLADLRTLKSKLCEGRKPSTVNDILFKAMAALFKIAVEDEVIEKSPMEKLKRVRKGGEPNRAQPTWEQAQQIEAEVGRYAAETALIIGFMRNFGVGQAEIHYLLGDHTDLKNGVIHFRRKKTGKPFDVPVFPHAQAFIKRLKDQGRFQTGKPVVTWRNPRKALEAACQRLDLPTYEPRALRRCFIVHCLQQGIDPRVVAKWQGHKDAKLIFTVYGKYIDQSYERAQAERLGGVAEAVPASANGAGAERSAA
jgi:integrase